MGVLLECGNGFNMFKDSPLEKLHIALDHIISFFIISVLTAILCDFIYETWVNFSEKQRLIDFSTLLTFSFLLNIWLCGSLKWTRLFCYDFVYLHFVHVVSYSIIIVVVNLVLYIPLSPLYLIYWISYTMGHAFNQGKGDIKEDY